MKIRPIFAWYDIWVGAYYDTKKRRLYLMIPFFGFYIEFGNRKGGYVGHRKKIERALARQARRFHAGLEKPRYPAPSLFMLVAFRMGRTSMRQMLDDSSRDYQYYAEKGWFESDYYYPTHLGPLKRIVGSLVDAMAPTVRNMLA